MCPPAYLQPKCVIELQDSSANPVFARLMHRCSGLVRIKTCQLVGIELVRGI